nr:hypothetical protein CFP56_11282 [Quercus suber]
MLRKGLVMAAKLLFLRVSTKRVEVRSHYLSLASLRLAENCTKGHIVGREPHESCMHRECLEGCRRVSCPKSWGLDWALRVSTKRVEVRSHYLSLASLRLAENCTKGHIVGREPHESCMHRECLEGCRRVSCPKSWGLDWALR